MLKISAKDISEFLKENDLKDLASAEKADYKDLLYHGFLARLVEAEEDKYMKQGFLLMALGTPMAVLSATAFPVALGATGAAVGFINVVNCIRGKREVKEILQVISMTIHMFDKVSPEESRKFLNNIDFKEFDNFLSRTYFCDSEM